MTCEATDPCNPHSSVMPLVEAIAHVHGGLGGGLLGLAIMQCGLWLILYAVTVNVIATPRLLVLSRWVAGVATYLLTGMLTLGLSFYALVPAMNWIGVVYLSIIWPLWIYANVGVPAWLAPLMFTFS